MLFDDGADGKVRHTATYDKELSTLFQGCNMKHSDSRLSHND